jgi:hypothetical protein
MLYDINNEKQILFLDIPKTSGDSITTWLDSNSNMVLGNFAGQHPSLSDMASLINRPCMSFAVVRNPWDRAVSGYFHIKSILGFVGSFQEFLTNIKNGNYKVGTPNIFQSQMDWITSPVDHIIKYENLNQEFIKIQEYVGSNEPLPVENTTEHNAYQDYYNDETIQLVREISEKDILEFRYAFEG